MRLAPAADGSIHGRSSEPGDPSFIKKGTTGQRRVTQAALIASQTKKIKGPSYMIDPRRSRFLAFWDPLCFILLVFTALITPYEVSFLEADLSWSFMFITNRLIDVLFFVDMVLQFFLYVEVVSESTTKGTTWITDPKDVARHYVRSWFVIDFVSVASSGFDVLQPDVTTADGQTTTNDLSRLRLLRVLRVLRLIKLARLLRSSRLVRRYATRVGLNYAFLSILRAVVTIILIAHWLACGWALQAYMQEDIGPSWLVYLGYCWDANGTAPLSASGVPLSGQLLKGGDYMCLAPVRIYSACFYWSVTTITSIGYGDIHPTPYNSPEQAISAVLMLAACVAWAQTLAVFCSAISTFNPEMAEFQRTMDDLNRFMSREGFQGDLRQRLRAYFHASKHLRLASRQRLLLTHMPPSLQGEVSWNTHQVWLKNVRFLRDASQRFMIDLSMQLHAVVFAPRDVPPRGYLYIIQRGVAIYQGKVLTKGKVWGEDVILYNKELRSTATARTMNYLEAYYLSRDELMALSSRHPETNVMIRQSTIWMALRRMMLRLARQYQRELSLRESAAAEDIKDEDGEDGKGRSTALSRTVTSKMGRAVNRVSEFASTGTLKGGADLDMRLDIVRREIEEERSLAAKHRDASQAQMAALTSALTAMHEDMRRVSMMLQHVSGDRLPHGQSFVLPQSYLPAAQQGNTHNGGPPEA